MNKDNTNATPKGEIKISLTKRKAIMERQKRHLYIAIFIIAAAIVLLVLVLTLFLKVKTVEAVGSILYSPEEIIEASGIEQGENIITLGSGNIEERLRNELPAIEKVRIRKKLPSTVVLEIEETEEIMFLAVGESYYSLDNNLRVVSRFDTIEGAEMKGLKRVYFPDVTRCIIGEQIVTDDPDIPEMVKQLSESLMKYELFYDITEIDFRDKFDIKLIHGIKYKVKLGNILECDTKLEILCGILKELDPQDVGTIDFSDGEIRNAVFSRS